jgi:hypothetical protein
MVKSSPSSEAAKRHTVGCLHKHGAHICLQDQHRSIVDLDFPPHLALNSALLLVRILQPIHSQRNNTTLLFTSEE